MLTIAATSLDAQVCHGTPAAGGVEYNYQKFSVGTANSGIATWAAKRVAIAGGFALRTVTPDFKGQDAHLRISGVFGSSRFSVCPGIRVGYQRDTWDAEPGVALKTNSLSLGGGVGFGYEQPVYNELSIAPFVVAGYQFNAVHYDLEATNSETDVTGDTLSGLAIEYGIVARYRVAYVGFAASRAPETEGRHPTSTRFIVGITFSGQGPRNSESASRSRHPFASPRRGAAR